MTAEMDATSAMDCSGDVDQGVTIPPYEEFSSTTANFWKAELSHGNQWYSKAAKWWENNCPPTVNGVLGGYAELDECDVKESIEFLEMIKGSQEKAGCTFATELVLDVAAGIGRVTKHLLSRFFTKVDLVEGNQRLLNTVPEFLGDKRSQLGDMYCSTMQDFTPARGRYDCIWIQWCIIYLTDADLAFFLRRCAQALRPGGVIVIKENMLDDDDSNELLKDEDDSSVTRSNSLMQHIFRQAGLDVLLQKPQVDFPQGMFSVMMYALTPQSSSSRNVAQ